MAELKLDLTLFGGMRASAGTSSPLALPLRKAQALLAYLALPPGRSHPRDKLAALLWSEVREDQARTSLRQALYLLRRALVPVSGSVLVFTGDAIALDPAMVDVDVVEFQRRVVDGRPGALATAVGLYKGELLEGVAVSSPPFDEWLLRERERLREIALEAMAKLLTYERTAGHLEAAIRTGLRLLALDPFQEAVRRTVVRLYLRLGRWGAALREYEAGVDIVHRELGLEPEPETRELYQQILDCRRTSEPARAVPATADARSVDTMRSADDEATARARDPWVVFDTVRRAVVSRDLRRD